MRRADIPVRLLRLAGIICILLIGGGGNFR
jgi:hypothetical protein